MKTTDYDHYGIAQSPSLACNEEQEGLVDAQLGLEGDEEREHHMLQGAKNWPPENLDIFFRLEI